MPKALKGQRSPIVMMYLSQGEPRDEAIRGIIQECARGHVDDMGRPRPPNWDEILFQTAKRSWGRILNFYLPECFMPGRYASTQLSIVLEMPTGLDLSTGRRIEPPEQMRGSRHWVYVTANSAHVRHTEQAEMAWFLNTARCPLEKLQPDFAFADTDTTLYKNLDSEPWERAWPLMIFGPEHVKKIGRDTLLDAPAWKVEELPYGGIWVQAWENPFDAPQKMVTALGKHLGLEARPN